MNFCFIDVVFWMNNTLSFKTILLFWRKQIFCDDALVLSNEQFWMCAIRDAHRQVSTKFFAIIQSNILLQELWVAIHKVLLHESTIFMLVLICPHAHHQMVPFGISFWFKYCFASSLEPVPNGVCRVHRYLLMNFFVSKHFLNFHDDHCSRLFWIMSK